MSSVLQASTQAADSVLADAPPKRLTPYQAFQQFVASSQLWLLVTAALEKPEEVDEEAIQAALSNFLSELTRLERRFLDDLSKFCRCQIVLPNSQCKQFLVRIARTQLDEIPALQRDLIFTDIQLSKYVWSALQQLRLPARRDAPSWTDILSIVEPEAEKNVLRTIRHRVGDSVYEETLINCSYRPVDDFSRRLHPSAVRWLRVLEHTNFDWSPKILDGMHTGTMTVVSAPVEVVAALLAPVMAMQDPALVIDPGTGTKIALVYWKEPIRRWREILQACFSKLEVLLGVCVYFLILALFSVAALIYLNTGAIPHVALATAAVVVPAVVFVSTIRFLIRRFVPVRIIGV